ncbi:PopZ family protein [Rhizobium sp. SSA_523]|uniref:PopZ family protein n=1 Tax=Rhizobium sp. SSA_523 TaxID=2952477 RepID=UPI0025AFBA41|nr:DUF2497 domain-containing protein [Rhizobium sp. SSA_523]WKC24676.1 DUF2497 domain-containing protein [Rhizobium sp. SSA_523]
MAQPNAAREPSMEEILASIRRIIESNDPVNEMQSGGTQDLDFAQDDDIADLSDEIDNPFLMQVAANDPGFPMTNDSSSLRGTHQPVAAAAARLAEAPEKSLSLADVAARVRAAAGRPPELRPAESRAIDSRAVEPRSAESHSVEPRAVEQRSSEDEGPVARAIDGRSSFSPAHSHSHSHPQSHSSANTAPAHGGTSYAPIHESPALQPRAVEPVALRGDGDRGGYAGEPVEAPDVARDALQAAETIRSHRAGDAGLADRLAPEPLPAMRADRPDAEASDGRWPQAPVVDDRREGMRPGLSVDPVTARPDVDNQSEPQPSAAPMSLPAKIEAAAVLISEEAGEQVARSFEHLADVFNGIERQSMEDMAREMLKPMLREWLDDNLPTLVERMVREEIERVARGPRR